MSAGVAEVGVVGMENRASQDVLFDDALPEDIGAALMWGDWESVPPLRQPIADLPERGRDDVWDRAGAMRVARRRLDMSQRELAAVLGTGASTIDRAESRESEVSLRVVETILARAGLRLAVVDAETELEVATEPAEVVRDRAGRRFPAHLDLRPGGWNRGPDGLWRRDRPEPQVTFDRRMARQRRRRREDCRPVRHPTSGEAEAAVRGPWWRRQEFHEGWCRVPQPHPWQTRPRERPAHDAAPWWGAAERTLEDLRDTDQIPDDPDLEDGAPLWWLELQRQAGADPGDPPSADDVGPRETTRAPED